MTPSARTATTRFRAALVAGEQLDGVVVRTPSHQVVEVLVADPGNRIDVVMFDREHAAFDAGTLDACLAVAAALDVPTLFRIEELTRAAIQQPLDLGATGVVVPHVATADDARRAVRYAHYGDGGRGFSGSTRSAGWGTRSMAEVVADAAERTTVIVQVEDLAALDDLAGIVGTPGVDAVFIGAADLAVAWGAASVTDPRVERAATSIVEACRAERVPVAAFAAGQQAVAAWRSRGATLLFGGTDQSRLR
ncbi:aldolase/citrate lyase family protein [soil metagenome]